MKATDLRIGNLAEYKGKIIAVCQFSKRTFWYIDGDTLHEIRNGLENLKPIELTEEWLLKMGFEKEIDDSGFIRKVYYYINDFEVEFHGKKLVFRVENENVTNYFAHHTKYVHQLQNLYHSLTGEELTIK